IALNCAAACSRLHEHKNFRLERWGLQPRPNLKACVSLHDIFDVPDSLLMRMAAATRARVDAPSFLPYPSICLLCTLRIRRMVRVCARGMKQTQCQRLDVIQKPRLANSATSPSMARVYRVSTFLSCRLLTTITL